MFINNTISSLDCFQSFFSLLIRPNTVYTDITPDTSPRIYPLTETTYNSPFSQLRAFARDSTVLPLQMIKISLLQYRGSLFLDLISCISPRESPNASTYTFRCGERHRSLFLSFCIIYRGEGIGLLDDREPDQPSGSFIAHSTWYVFFYFCACRFFRFFL